MTRAVSALYTLPALQTVPALPTLRARQTLGALHTVPTLLEAAARATAAAAFRAVLPYGGQRTALRNAAAAVAQDQIRAQQRRLAA
jgi:hypothetical protein